MTETTQNTQDVKSKIRQRYLGVSPDLLDVIPAKPLEDIFASKNTQNIAIYCRVSTGDPRQTSSYELQKNHYSDFISRTPNWNLVNIYADEGISGTSLNHREAFQQMIEDCKTGNIDLIVTKSVSRFARNVVDCIQIVRDLRALPHPVGVFFETEYINTLDPKSEMSLSMLAAMAQEESHNKSEIMNSSIEMRFQRGIFLTPPLIGYKRDEDGNLIIDEPEAQTIRLIFKLALNGSNCSQIAETLTDLGIRTKRGKPVWKDGTIRNILTNERYCGDVLARKTFTPNYLNHKSKKNRQDRNQYRQRNHHEAIIPREEFEAVQRIVAAVGHKVRTILPELTVITEGPLKGFISINPRWPGFRDYDYVNACKNAYGIPLPFTSSMVQNMQPEPPHDEGTPSSASDASILTDPPPTFEAFVGDFDLRSFEVVHAQFFSCQDSITLTFKNANLIFNPAAIRAMDTECVELLIHPLKKLLLVRPSYEGMPNFHNAVAWIMTSNNPGDRKRVKQISGRTFLPTIYALLGWHPECRYRLTGYKIRTCGKPAILFQLSDFECLVPLALAAECFPEGILPVTDTRKKHALAFPEGWEKSFGTFPYLSEKPPIQSGKPGDALKPETTVTYRDPRLELPPKAETQEQVTRLLADIKSTNESVPPVTPNSQSENSEFPTVQPETPAPLLTDKEAAHE